MNPVPPKFQEPKFFFGFSSRDLTILSVGAMLFMAAFVTPISFTIRVVIAVAVVVVSLVVIFFRTSSGYTLEEILWFWFAYVNRSHYHQRGSDQDTAALNGVGGLQIVPRKTRSIDYFWIVWRRFAKSDVVTNAVDRTRAFYALAHGEPAPTYYRSVWIRELSAFVYIAGRNKTFNYLDLKSMYPSVNFWRIVDVMVGNDLLKWESETVLVCKDVRRMRAVVRRGLLDLPETDNGLLSYDTLI